MSRSLNIFVPHCSAVLTDHLPNGDGLIAHGFITHLARRGHRLHVAAESVALREPLHPNVTVHQIQLEGHGKFSKRLAYMMHVRRLLRDLSKEHRFDLIHQLNPVFTGMSLALAGSGLPLVLGTYVARWPEDSDPMKKRGLLGRGLRHGRDAIAALQQQQADALVLTTPAARNRLPNPDRVGDRTYFLPHGIDIELFSPAADLEPKERAAAEKPVSILFFANLVRRKGIFTLVDALPSVLRDIPSARLRIAGDGPDTAEVKLRVSEIGCAGQVDFLGRQERSDGPALYRDCTVYCLPSFGEPYGTTLVEAMSCGKPVVVTDAGGPPHIVSREGSLCVPVGDADALAKALLELLRDPDRCAAMGKQNRIAVEEKMSWDKVAQRLEGIYEDTLSRTKAEEHPSTPGRGRLIDGEAVVSSVQLCVADAGLETTRLGFGCANLMGRLSRRESRRLLDAAFANGIRHFDTAPLYGYGEAESVLGDFLKDRRDQVTVATKVGILPPEGGAFLKFAKSGARTAVRLFPKLRGRIRHRTAQMARVSSFVVADCKRSLERSLRHLGTDCTDALLLHEVSPDQIGPELVNFLEDAKRRGLIRHYGTATTAQNTILIRSLGLPSGEIAQFPNSVFENTIDGIADGSEGSFITHSSLGVTFGSLAERLQRDFGFRRVWSDELGFDCSDLSRVGMLLLSSAMQDNRTGIVLFSSSKERTIQQNAALLREKIFSDSQLTSAKRLAGSFSNAAAATS